MKFLTLIALCSMALAAQNSYAKTCVPSSNNQYLTAPMTVVAVAPTTLIVSGIQLSLDRTYAPRNKTSLVRFIGDTATASGWQDSGQVEVLYGAGESVLQIRIRGEIFITENFKCQ